MAEWFAFLTHPLLEARVAERLERTGYTVFLPTTGRGRPAFPRRLFCRVDQWELVRVLRTPGIAGVVSENGNAVPIPVAEIDNLRVAVDVLAADGSAVIARPCRPGGLPVRVVRGKFASVEGRIRQDGSPNRLLVGPPQVDEALEIEVEGGTFEPVPNAEEAWWSRWVAS